MFFGLLDPDPDLSVSGMDPDTDLDPSIPRLFIFENDVHVPSKSNKQKKKFKKN
jgi:hypothetical protein